MDVNSSADANTVVDEMNAIADNFLDWAWVSGFLETRDGGGDPESRKVKALETFIRRGLIDADGETAIGVVLGIGCIP